MIYDLRLRAVERVALNIFINSSASARNAATFCRQQSGKRMSVFTDMKRVFVVH